MHRDELNRKENQQIRIATVPKDKSNPVSGITVRSTGTGTSYRSQDLVSNRLKGLNISHIPFPLG